MVRILIDLRRSIARHQLAGTHPALLAVTGLLVLASAVGTLLLGAAGYAHDGTATDVLALVSLLWIGGRLAQSAMTGEPFLHPEMFGLLPVPRRRLARSLLVVGLADPANVLLAVASAAMIARGARLGLAATAAAIAAVLLTVAVTSVLATVAAGLLGPGARRGHDAGTVLTAVLISLIAMAGTLLPALISALQNRSAPWLTALLRALPTGWGPDAVAAAGRGDLAGTLLPLAGIAALGALAAAVWPRVLGRRMQGRRPARRGRDVRAGRRSPLGSTPIGAVAAKELRMWARDPIRLTCLVIALVVGTGAGVVPRITAGTGLLLPFAGAMTVVIAGACACNVYGNDGPGIWPTIMTPGSARADVRGRQLGWLLAVGPYAAASTLVLTAVSGEDRFWPWAVSLVTALLGGAAGLLPLASLIAPQPLDAAGNPTPGWSVKVHIALLAVPLTALPTLLALLAGLGWVAVPIAAATGALLAFWLGARAVTVLQERQVALLQTLTRNAQAPH
ncbi:hypothetical protein [Actinomadura violacea]|uniref:ABC-2 type transport system permease protein n=1 Tax=Actinomadura violacea TaxID=2819934 RepID=A0ABS3RT11_9ACTN|nr:hypothetical protein [Actinomadura violacea]MBO2459901.1 hypothetical protein [Actinomadura violacea]